MLQRLLDQEEKVHEILEMVHNRPNGAAISIPNFLPPKVRNIIDMHFIFPPLIIQVCIMIPVLCADERASSRTGSS